MIKVPEDILREFEVKLGVDRDCEIPLLLEFLQKIAPIDSLLDIGAHTSCIPEKYGQEVRKLVKRYDGIDILPPTETESILDYYYVGNACDDIFPCNTCGHTEKCIKELECKNCGYCHNPYSPKKYDVVVCLSSIEHSGVSIYKSEDPYKERDKLFMKCLELAKKYLWISFPVGQEYTYPNELSIITDKQLKRWETLTSNFKVKERFLYNQGPQAKHPWYEHSKREVAVRIPYIDYVGNSSLCVMEIEKGGDVK